MKLTWHKVKYILFQSDKLYAEAICCTTVLGWAIILLITNPTLFVTSPAYVPMNNTFPQVVWGIMFFLAGTFQLGGLLREHLMWLRICGCALGSFLWVWVAVSFKLTNSVPTGILVYSVLAFTSSLIAVQHSYEYWGRKPKVRANDGSE